MVGCFCVPLTRTLARTLHSEIFLSDNGRTKFKEKKLFLNLEVFIIPRFTPPFNFLVSISIKILSKVRKIS